MVSYPQSTKYQAAITPPFTLSKRTQGRSMPMILSNEYVGHIGDYTYAHSIFNSLNRSRKNGQKEKSD